MSEFSDRLRFLSEQIGRGHLVGSVEVDQVYAHYQHEHPEFHHPDGGEAFYLLTPLYAKGTSIYMARLAEHAITEKGSSIQGAMQDNMEDLSGEVFNRAPWEFGDLRASGHPVVRVNGEVVYDRAPNVERVDPEGLRAKARLRQLFDPDRYGRR